MKRITEVDDKKLNEINILLSKKYSKKMIECLILGQVMNVYQLDDLNDVPIFYSKRLSSYDIVMNNLLDYMNRSVSDFLCDLGKKKFNNIIVCKEKKLIIEILNENILNDKLNIVCYTSYIDDTCAYYVEGDKKDTILGYDAPSYYRNFRCFNKKSDLNFEESIYKISAILNIGDRLNFSFDKEYNCYYVYLDDNILGLWSEKLIQDFLNESYDIYQSENHDNNDCFDCNQSELCKYADKTKSFEKELLTDKLNIPAFSIMNLCKVLGVEILEKD